MMAQFHFSEVLHKFECTLYRRPILILVNDAMQAFHWKYVILNETNLVAGTLFCARKNCNEL